MSRTRKISAESSFFICDHRKYSSYSEDNKQIKLYYMEEKEMLNNGFIKMVIIMIQGVIGHYAEMYRPAIVDIIGKIGYNMICIAIVVTIVYMLGFFGKERC